MYPIHEQLLSQNRSKKYLRPKGFVVHSTATAGATVQNEYSYFNSAYRGASAHYFVDWNEIIRTIPESEVAYHAGPTANYAYLSVEMCEPEGYDSEKFKEVWERTVWLVADACVRYGWNTNDNVFSHRGISQMFKQTDHNDPIEFLARYGKTWEELLSAIDQETERIKSGGKRMFENLVVYGGYDDGAAKLLADKLKAPVVHIDNVTGDLWSCAKNKFKVGGEQFRDAKLVSGGDRFATMQAVLNL